MELLYCLDSEPTFLSFFDPSIAPALLYYAYIPILLISIILGILVLTRKTEFHLPNKLFFAITLLFSLYIINEIIQWIAVPAAFVQTGWELIAFYFTALTLLLVYFVTTLLRGRDMYFYEKVILVLLAVPVLVFLPTNLNMGTFDVVWCESTTGPLYFYIYSLAGLSAMYMLIQGLRYYLKSKSKIALPLVVGAALFILFLTGADLFSYVTGDFEINLIGPIGMILFMTAISYIIVKFQIFNIKLIAAQALVLSLIILVASQLLFTKSATNQILITINLVISCFGGYFLVQSVRREVKQREEIEQLAVKLEKANKRLKVLDQLKSEFVSVASHQLRSPLTSVRGYASMLLEGSYGALSDKARDAIERIAESSRMMALSVEDYLNVSRIQAGNMKYILTDFNLAEMSSHIVDDIRRDAVKKGLVLSYKSDLKGQGVVHADNGKTMQILHNLINNSIKYTPKGTVTVFAHDQGKKLFIDVIDTGIGMSKETISSIFGKFERAKNANEVNVTGTGLGLYVAQKMAQEMGGNIEAYSDGEGRGSTFRLIMPLQL